MMTRGFIFSLCCLFVHMVCAQELSVQFSTTDLSCNGDQSGQIEITGATCSSGGSFEIPPNPFNCGMSFDQVLTGSSITVEHGDTVLIQNATGTINVNNGTALICGGVNIQNLNIAGPSHVYLEGSMVVNSLHVNTGASFSSYGAIQVLGQGAFNSNFYNYGSFQAVNGMNINYGAEFFNAAPCAITGQLYVDGTLTNYDNFEANNNFQANSTGKVRNYGTITSAGQAAFESGAHLYNHGIFSGAQLVLLRSHAIYAYAGSEISGTELRLENSTIHNPNSGGCASLKGTSLVNALGTNTLSGFVSVCAQENSNNLDQVALQDGAVIGCECVPNPTGGSGGGDDSGPVTVLWDDNGSTALTRTSLAAGVYHGTVTKGSCSAPISVQILEPLPLELHVETYPPSCAGKVDGGVNLMVSGGTLNYHYWLDNTSYPNSEIMGLASGTYLVTVKDSNDCEVQETAVVPEGVINEVDYEIVNDECYSDEGATVIIHNCEDTDDIIEVGTCFDLENFVPQYSCTTCSNTISGNGYISLTPGVEYCLTTSYDGYIDINGATLIVCGPDVHLTSLVLDADDRLAVAGKLTVGNLSINSASSELLVYGELNLENSLPINGPLLNYGLVSVTSNLHINPGAIYTNYGTTTVGGNVTVDHMLENNGAFYVQGTMYNNSNGVHANGCITSVSGDLFLDAPLTVSHSLYVDGTLHHNNNGNLTLGAGALVEVGVSVLNAGVTLTAANSSCAVYRVLGETRNNSSITMTGNLSFCNQAGFKYNNHDPILENGASLDCSCVPLVSPESQGNSDCQVTWSNGSTGSTIQGVFSDTLVVTVDHDGCVSTDSIIIDYPDSLFIQPEVTDVSCRDHINDGSIRLDVSGGVLPISVNWFGPDGFTATGTSVDSLVEGTYTYQVIDGNGCEKSGQVLVGKKDEDCAQPCLGEVDYELIVINETCEGDNDAKVLAQFSDELNFSHLKWERNDELLGEELILRDLSPGTYDFEAIVESNGLLCLLVDQVSVDGAPRLQIDQVSIEPSCISGNNGSVSFEVVGASSGYVVYWPDVTTSGNSRTNLRAGQYTVEIVDGNLCSAIETFDVPQSQDACNSCDSLEMSIAVRPISCSGNFDGALTVALTNELDDQEFRWTRNGVFFSNQRNLTGLGAGNYELELKQEGCKIEQAVRLTQPDSLHVEVVMYDASCSEAADGVLDMVISGGTRSYHYQWSNADADLVTNTGLLPGSYFLSVEDANGCQFEEEYTISVENDDCQSCNGFEVQVQGQNVSCSGDQDGLLQVLVEGANPVTGYSLNWEFPNGMTSTSTNLDNLTEGPYQLEVQTELNGRTCDFQKTIELVEESSLRLVAQSNPQSCDLVPDGAIRIHALGGVEPYLYHWDSPGLSGGSINGLSAGTYTVEVEDGLGCEDSIVVTIETGDQIACDECKYSHLSFIKDDISCNGASNGVIDMTIITSLEVASISWIGPDGFTSGEQFLYGLSPGVYTVQVQLVQGQFACTLSEDVEISEPENLALNVVVDPANCHETNGGSIRLIPSGGTGNYAYYWCNQEYNDQVLEGLGTGTYVVEMTDENNCLVKRTISVPYDDQYCDSCSLISVGVSKQEVSCFGGSDGRITVEVTGADQYTATLSRNANSSTGLTYENLQAGSYELRIEAALNGHTCVRTRTIVINEPERITAETVVNNASLGGESYDAQVHVDILGGTKPYHILWSNGQVNSLTTYLPEGEHQVVVTDANGCQAGGAFNVSSNAIEDPECNTFYIQLNGQDLSCFGTNDGQLEVSAPGFEGEQVNYTWKATTGLLETGDALTDLAGGLYVVEAEWTSEQGRVCSRRAVYRMQQPREIGICFSDHGSSCEDGIYNLSVALRNGEAPFLYTWSDAQGQILLSGPQANSLPDPQDNVTYNFQVQDGNGCTNEKEIVYHRPNASCQCDEITYQVNPVNPLCHQSNSGQIRLTFDQQLSGSSFFNWTGPNNYRSNDKDLVDLAAGQYQLNALVEYQGVLCPIQIQAGIEFPTPLEVSPIVTATSCIGESDGSVELDVSGGTPPYTYSWSEASACINGQSAGTHSVTVTDANGCSETISYTILEGDDNCFLCDVIDIQFTGRARNCSIGDDDVTAVLRNVPAGASITSSWTTPTGEQVNEGEVLINPEPGIYVFNVSLGLPNGIGCQETKTYYVFEQVEPLEIDFDVVHASCETRSDGAIIPKVTGGQGPYSFEWCLEKEVFFDQDGYNEECIKEFRGDALYGLKGGRSYEVLVSDNHACESDTITIFVDNLSCSSPRFCSWFDPTVIVNHIDEDEGNTGRVELQLPGSMDEDDVFIEWRNEEYDDVIGGGLVADGLGRGMYSVRVEMGWPFSCKAVRAVAVNQSFMDVDFDVLAPTNCTDGSVTVSDVRVIKYLDGEQHIADQLLVNENNYTNSTERYDIIEGLGGCAIEWNEVVPQYGTSAVGLEYGPHEVVFDCHGVVSYEVLDIGTQEFLAIIEDQTICEGGSAFVSTTRDVNGTLVWEQEIAGAGRTPLDMGTVEVSPTGNHLLRVSPAQTTSYIATYTNSFGCVSERVTTVNVLQRPTMDIPATIEVCQGNEASVELLEGPNYKWYLNGEPVENPVSHTFSFVPGHCDELVVEVETEECAFDHTIEVVVLPFEQLTIPEKLSFCEGGEVHVDVEGYDQLNIIPLAGVTQGTNGQLTFAPTDDQAYVIFVEDENGCRDSSGVLIKVHEPFHPVAGINEGACLGNSFELTVTEGVSYNWYPNDGFIQDAATQTPVVTSNGPLQVYHVDVENEKGCIGTASVNVTPVGIVSTTGPVVMCVDGQATLSASGGNTYSWSPADGLNNRYDQNPVTDVSQSTTYTVTASNEHGCNYQAQVEVVVDPHCDCYKNPNTPDGMTFYWVGLGVLHQWTDVNNWSVAQNVVSHPARVPGENDHVVIDLANNLTNTPALSADQTIYSICMLEGTLDLQSHQLTILDDGTFTGGEVIGNDLSNGVFADGTVWNRKEVLYFSGTVFHVEVRSMSSSRVYLNGSEFHKEVRLAHDGNRSIACAGGNTFHADAYLTNEGEAEWSLAALEQGTEDKFEESVTFTNTGSGRIHATASQTDVYKGNIFVNSSRVDFGKRGGTVLMKGNRLQFIGTDSPTGITTTMRHLKVRKPANSEVSAVQLAINVRIGMNNGGTLDLIRGHVITSSDALLTLKSGVDIPNFSSQSFVSGPLRRLSGGDVNFPIGKEGRLMPVVLHNISANDQGYTMEYFDERAPELTLDSSVTAISQCEYWTIDGPEDPGMDVELSWDNVSCDIPNDLTKLMVAYHDGTSWKSAGHDSYEGSRSRGGSILSAYPLVEPVWLTLGSELKRNNGTPTGFSFNNYGAAVKVTEGGHLGVFGSMLNEHSNEGDEGTVINDGTILLTQDWTNNVANGAFKDDIAGDVQMIGDVQRIRGVHPTDFFDLKTLGSNRKEMYVDANIMNQFFVNDVETATNENILYVVNDTVDAIVRELTQSGFVSSRTNGFLKRNIHDANAGYLFPVGERRKYRPVNVFPAYTVTNDYSVRMVNHDPNVDGFYRGKRSPFVASVNEHFYHWIERSYGVDSLLSDTIYKVSLSINYTQNDGIFQDIGHWDDTPLPSLELNGHVLGPIIDEELIDNGLTNDGPPYWRALPELDGEEGIYGILNQYILISNVNDFTQPQFSLINRGYLFNTEAFGDPAGTGVGVPFTLGGDGFINGSPVSITSQPGFGQTIGPNHLGSTHIIHIEGNATNTPGDLQVLVDDNGRIVSIQFMDDEGNLYELADGLVDLQEGTPLEGWVLELNSGEESEPLCQDDFEFNLVGSSNYAVPQGEGAIELRGVEEEFVRMNIYNRAGVSVLEFNNGSPQPWSIAGLSPGGYRFVMTLSLQGTEKDFNGQFIITE